MTLLLTLIKIGKAIYSPAEISSKAIDILSRIASLHRSANILSTPFYPIPKSKQIMSDSDHLAIFSQLILSNDTTVVETTANLLKSLIEFNPAANSKLYLTGIFFFACKYTSNNFNTIANLFYISHLKQSFHDSTASISSKDIPIDVKSILGIQSKNVVLLHLFDDVY